METALGRLHSPQTTPDVVNVAVGIHSNGRHVGILYRMDRTVRFIDFTGPHSLRWGRFRGGYHWGEPAIDAEMAENIACLCDVLGKRYGNKRSSFRYAVRWTGTCLFSLDGQLNSQGGDTGFTCATFILAVFASFGAPLVHWEQWLPRSTDAAAFDEMRSVIEQYPLEPEELDTQLKQFEAQRGCARIRPSELTAAAIWHTVPIGFDIAEPLGERIIQHIAAALASAALPERG
jgi:hypothetical protein